MKKEVKVYPKAKTTKISTTKEDEFIDARSIRSYSPMDNQYHFFKGKSINYHFEISDPKIVRTSVVIMGIILLIPVFILFFLKIRIIAIFVLALDIALVVDAFKKKVKKIIL